MLSLKLIYKVSEKYLRKVPQFIFNKTAFLTPGNLTKKKWTHEGIFQVCLLVAASVASNIWQR